MTNKKSKDFDSVPIHVPIGCRDKINKEANRRCMTTQRFIREAINAFAGKKLIPTDLETRGEKA